MRRTVRERAKMIANNEREQIPALSELWHSAVPEAGRTADNICTVQETEHAQNRTQEIHFNVLFLMTCT